MNLLNVKQVATKLSCSVSYVWKLPKADHTFPKAINIGTVEGRTRATRWADQDITDWLLTRKQNTTEVLNNEDGRPGKDLHTAAGEEVPA